MCLIFEIVKKRIMSRIITKAILVSTYNWPQALELAVKSIFRQTDLPDEILIADDGSGDETQEMVEILKKESPIPIKYIWHPDKGFRLSAIRNRAISECEMDYLIQVDGDIILHEKFVEDHMSISREGFFVSGKRAYIKQRESRLMIDNSSVKVRFFKLKDKMQVVRLPHFMNFRRLSSIYNPNKGIKGSNMAFWMKDLYLVNGYDENLEMWGFEDKEIAARLINNGILKKRVRYRCLSYHLYHNETSKANLKFHGEVLDKVINNKVLKCENGLSKYIK